MSTTTAELQIPAGTYTIDKVHSTIGFAVKHMVVSTFRGRFEDYDATLTANEDGTLRLEGRVSADSKSFVPGGFIACLVEMTSTGLIVAKSYEFLWVVMPW